tara:strand:+ start:751 stop:1443 length:693 start_codon:yes stop_codon:yes gene_type:complete
VVPAPFYRYKFKNLCPYGYTYEECGVAQLVEQLTVNQPAAGSSPAAAAKTLKEKRKMNKLPQTPYDTVCVSGGFDPVHIGHLRMIQEAAQHGDVIVIVNSDEWLMRKKGYIFMPFAERCEILRGFAAVNQTTHVDDTDGTVCEALQRLKPTFFANGGDRKTDNTPEMDVCDAEGIQLLWGTGGGKIQSSSDLVADSGMVTKSDIADCDIDLQPSRVDVISSGDLPKSSDY